MSLPSDKEQKEILRWQEEKQKERTNEDGPTTQKINKKLSEAEQRVLEQMAQVWSAVIDNKQKVEEHDGFISKVKRAFGGVVKG